MEHNSKHNRLKVLICEDNSVDAEICLHELRRAGFEPEFHRVETEADLLDAVFRTEAFVQLATVADVFQLALRESAALAGLDVADFDRSPQATVVFNDVTGADFVTVYLGHGSYSGKIVAVWLMIGNWSLYVDGGVTCH